MLTNLPCQNVCLQKMSHSLHYVLHMREMAAEAEDKPTLATLYPVRAA